MSFMRADILAGGFGSLTLHTATHEDVAVLPASLNPESTCMWREPPLDAVHIDGCGGTQDCVAFESMHT